MRKGRYKTVKKSRVIINCYLIGEKILLYKNTFEAYDLTKEKSIHYTYFDTLGAKNGQLLTPQSIFKVASEIAFFGQIAQKLI